MGSSTVTMECHTTWYGIYHTILVLYWHTISEHTNTAYHIEPQTNTALRQYQYGGSSIKMVNLDCNCLEGLHAISLFWPESPLYNLDNLLLQGLVLKKLQTMYDHLKIKKLMVQVLVNSHLSSTSHADLNIEFIFMLQFLFSINIA